MGISDGSSDGCGSDLMAALLALLAYVVLRSPRPEITGETDVPNETGNGKTLKNYPHLWFGVACLFFYMGAEVMAGDAIGTYGEGLGLPVKETSYFTSLTLASMLRSEEHTSELQSLSRISYAVFCLPKQKAQ